MESHRAQSLALFWSVCICCPLAMSFAIVLLCPILMLCRWLQLYVSFSPENCNNMDSLHCYFAAIKDWIAYNLLQLYCYSQTSDAQKQLVHLSCLQLVQKAAARLLTNTQCREHIALILVDLHCPPFVTEFNLRFNLRLKICHFKRKRKCKAAGVDLQHKGLRSP